MTRYGKTHRTLQNVVPFLWNHTIKRTTSHNNENAIKGIRTLYCYVYDVAVVVVLYKGWLSVHTGKVPHTAVSTL